MDVTVRDTPECFMNEVAVGMLFGGFRISPGRYSQAFNLFFTLLGDLFSIFFRKVKIHKNVKNNSSYVLKIQHCWQMPKLKYFLYKNNLCKN